MKAHKYWGLGSFICMAMCIVSGTNKKMMHSHKYFAMGAFGCMLMAMLSGYSMIGGCSKKKVEKADE